jgi:hypothetical protein
MGAVGTGLAGMLVLLARGVLAPPPAPAPPKPTPTPQSQVRTGWGGLGCCMSPFCGERARSLSQWKMVSPGVLGLWVMHPSGRG